MDQLISDMGNAGFEVACPPENHADATLGKSRLARSILAAQLARGSESKNETDKRQDKEKDFISERWFVERRTRRVQSGHLELVFIVRVILRF